MINRTIALVVSLGAVAAGCSGASGGSEQVGAEPTSETTAGPTESTTDVDEESQDPVDGPPAETDSDTIIVETAYGEHEVPANPERILVLDPVVALPTALDLGVSVVGTMMFENRGQPLISVLTDEEWALLESVGTPGLDPLETIAAARPDLILASPRSPEDFELLEQIAPSVALIPSSDWRDDALVVAASLGKTQEMEAQLAAYDEQADDLAKRIDEELGDPTFAIVRVRPDALRIHTSQHFAGNLLADAGLRMPEEWIRETIEDDPIANLRQRVIEISPELIGDLATADHILFMVLGTLAQTEEDVAASQAAIETGGLWQSLPAVQNGNVHYIGAHWLVGSRRAASMALSDLEGFLLDEG